MSVFKFEGAWVAKIALRPHVYRRVSAGAGAPKEAATELERRLKRLVKLRRTGEVLDDELAGWLRSEIADSLRRRLAKWGLIDATGMEAARPLTAHVNDYCAALAAGGASPRQKGPDSPRHVELTRTRLTKVLDGTGAKLLADLTAERVMRYLAQRRADGLSIEASNGYLRALRAFCRWLVDTERAVRNPLARVALMNADDDKRLERRALDEAELRELLTFTSSAGVHHGMTGAQRAALYRLVVTTGLRANEVRSLTKGSFELTGDEPTVSVAAGYSKRRRADTLPLLPEVARELAQVLERKLPKAKAFSMPPEWEVADMLRVDLSGARMAWLLEAQADPAETKRRTDSDFLKTPDAAGKVVDFHGLRHTFITALARAGVHPKEAQALARHSSITLTMDRYTHVSVRDQRRALTALPDLSMPAADAQAKTGTDDESAGNRTNFRTRSEAKPAPVTRSRALRCAETRKRELSPRAGVSSANPGDSRNWAQLGSNQRPADYESAALTD